MNYQNQKEVYIDKKEINKVYNKEGENDFLHSLSWNKLLPITRELNGNEFKVWLYCMKWSGKDKFYFSPASLTQDFNISESTAQRAFKTLEKLGYLIKDTDKRGYNFYQCGQH